ncbi:MAG: PilZ domain-containing protein [Sphingomonas phyllosphaerae]|uniref:PilZ domain-containing protein n=1 Tax=Sphingomonas phyllosphaerae TaxID=257003 RepID=UPI002FFBC05A
MSESPPREPRSSVILYARIDHRDRSVEVRVRNLSATGACIENPGELTKGDELSVTMGSLSDLTAEVMWTSPKLAGLHFTKGAIDLAEARKPRDRGANAPKASAGWINNIQHAYRRRDD